MMRQLTLKELIEYFEQRTRESTIGIGLTNPHSSQFDNYQLAFEPCAEQYPKDVLKMLKECVGQYFPSPAGGMCKMDKHSWVNLAYPGEEGVPMTILLLESFFRIFHDEDIRF